MQKKRITLKDIARETGVHVSTVSRALDPVERKTITEEVAKRIQAAAESLGYRPNRIAAGLRTNRTMTVGVMIPDITNVIFPPILRGIESVLEPLGYASIIVNTDSERDREIRLLDVLRDRGVDGIIHAAVLRSDPSIAKAAQDGLPVVTLNRRVEASDIPYVINDEDAGICQMLRHLRELGHTRIAHIAGPQDLSTGQLRLAAFRRAAEDLDTEVDENLIVVATRFDEQEGSPLPGRIARLRQGLYRRSLRQRPPGAGRHRGPARAWHRLPASCFRHRLQRHALPRPDPAEADDCQDPAARRRTRRRRNPVAAPQRRDGWMTSTSRRSCRWNW